MPVDCAALPKAELHCHADGLLDPPMLEQLIAEGERVAASPEELAACYPVDSIDRWLHAYGAVARRCQEPHDRWLPRMIELHVARLRAQRVTYAELFVSGLLMTRADLGELVELFAALRERIDRATDGPAADGGSAGHRTQGAADAAGPALRVELVVCIGRNSFEKTAAKVERILALRRAGLIRGVSLAGAEEQFPVRPLAPFFAAFRDAGLGIEIHAGEFGDADSVRDALEYGHPDRLGHGLAAFADRALLDRIGERGIHLELCPSSNLCLGRVARIEDHPIAIAKDLGLSFSINTDDPGPFACTLTSELELVATTFGWTEADLQRVFAHTMAAAFADR